MKTYQACVFSLLLLGGCLMITGCTTPQLSKTQPLGFAAGATPFPQAHLVKGESLLFIDNGAGTAPSASLLFAPAKVLRVYRPSTGETYQAGRDFTFDPAAGELTLTAHSRIPRETHQRMYPAPNAPDSIAQHVSGESWLYLTAGQLHESQVQVDYQHCAQPDPAWEAVCPRSQSAALPRLTSKLQTGQSLGLLVLGDSISVGGDVSGLHNRRPFIPSYSILFAQQIEQRYGCPVSYLNASKGGMTSQWGEEQARQIAAWPADLAIIAFGMNDVSLRMTPEEYGAHIKAMIEIIRAQNPHCEFILISTMVANPEWTASAPELYHQCRAQLESLAGSGIVVADMTSIWEEMLKRKKYLDITANGVNHPNDFGHRIYAWALGSLIATNH